MIIRIYFVIGIFILSGCGNNSDELAVYNSNLMKLEARLEVCSALELEKIDGPNKLSVSERELRIGLSYFYLKNSMECYKSERLAMLESARKLLESPRISNLISTNAKGVVALYSSDDAGLQQAENEFTALDENTKRKLVTLSVSTRVFSPSLANSYYFE
jgi:hypothetical protein